MGCTTIRLLKIVRSIMIFSHCEEERRSNPNHNASLRGGTTKQSPFTTILHSLIELLIRSNQGIASSRHWDFDNSNIVFSGLAITVKHCVFAW